MRLLVLLKPAVNLSPATVCRCHRQGATLVLNIFMNFQKMLNSAKEIAKGPGNMNHEKKPDHKSPDSVPSRKGYV